MQIYALIYCKKKKKLKKINCSKNYLMQKEKSALKSKKN